MPTILVVDDEPLACETTSRMLRQGRHTVLSATSGREALALLASSKAKPDLLLLDVLMPGMSGPELAQKAEELAPGIPVLFISGNPALGFRQRPEAVPRIVMKPFSVSQILTAVDQVLPSSRDPSPPNNRSVS